MDTPSHHSPSNAETQNTIPTSSTPLSPHHPSDDRSIIGPSIDDDDSPSTPPRRTSAELSRLAASAFSKATILPILPLPSSYHSFEPHIRYDSDDDETEDDDDGEGWLNDGGGMVEEYGDWSDWDDPRLTYGKENGGDDDGEEEEEKKEKKEKMVSDEEKKTSENKDDEEEKEEDDENNNDESISNKKKLKENKKEKMEKKPPSFVTASYIYQHCDDDEGQSMHPLSYIYLGSRDAAANYRWLKEKNITHIITAGCGMPPSFPSGFDYLIIPINDYPTENLLSHFDTIHSFIDNARENKNKKEEENNTNIDGDKKKSGVNILIHCAAGVSRSATVVASYLIKTLHIPLRSALRIIKSHRPWICPNHGFRKQLKFYQKEILKIEDLPTKIKRGADDRLNYQQLNDDQNDDDDDAADDEEEEKERQAAAEEIRRLHLALRHESDHYQQNISDHSIEDDNTPQ